MNVKEWLKKIVASIMKNMKKKDLLLLKGKDNVVLPLHLPGDVAEFARNPQNQDVKNQP